MPAPVVITDTNNVPVGPGWLTSHLAANATTDVKTGAGTLKSITINKKGASSNVLTIYDGAAGAGTVIGIIDTTVQPGTYFYNAAFTTGLSIVIGTGTAGDVTVTYR